MNETATAKKKLAQKSKSPGGFQQSASRNGAPSQVFSPNAFKHNRMVNSNSDSILNGACFLRTGMTLVLLLLANVLFMFFRSVHPIFQ